MGLSIYYAFHRQTSTRHLPVSLEIRLSGTDITQLLASHRNGDTDAMRQLMVRVYPVLKDLARRQLPRARGNTLNTTGVVHDAYLRFVERAERDFENRDHFLAFAAKVMRQVVVDHVRARYAMKRGSGKVPLTLDEGRLGRSDAYERTLLVDQLLDGLGDIDERLVRVVECRYFAGLTEEETARVLGVTSRTVQRDWRRARAWLQQALEDGEAES